MARSFEPSALPRGRYVLESLENVQIAEIEDGDGRRFVIPRGWLPGGLRVGDVIAAVVVEGDDDARVLLALDEAATEARRSALNLSYSRQPRGPEGELDG
ncbi:MAG: DUF3006 domain-containing protein [Trueperaceae bacterium]|nr:DUF3006 domain-containing protein [Trueperaceae bacterium]